MLFEQGIEAFKSENFGSSELMLRKIVESDENEFKDRAYYYLALSIFYQKKYKSAIFEFNRFLSICTSAELCILSRYWIAESFYLQNDYIKSIEEFRRFISLSKNDEYIANSYDRIGRVYFIQKRYDEAILEWMKALGKGKDELKNNQKRLNIGEAYFLNKKYDAAIGLLKPLLNSRIDTKTIAKARLIIGRAYQINGKNKTAIKIFSKIDESLLRVRPFNEILYYRAISYIAIGNLNFASLHLETFLSTGNHSKWTNYAKLELGKIYLKEKKIKTAAELLEEVRKSDTNSMLKSKASMELSKLYLDTNTEEAINCLNEALRISAPAEKKEALLLLSKAYSKIKKYKEAEEILEQLVAEFSFDKDIDSIQFLLGAVYLEQGNFEKAIEGFDKVKEINPFSKYINETYYYLALAYLKNKETGKAIDLFNKYTRLKKIEKKYEAYVQLLDIYLLKKDFKSGKKVIYRIIKFYLSKRAVEDVIFKYGVFLKKNGKNYKYYFNLVIKNFSNSNAAGNILLIQGDEAFIKKSYKLAERNYRKYLSVKWREKAASVFLYRIISLENLGRNKEIIIILESEDTRPPLDDFTNKQLFLWLAKSYYSVGDYKNAYDSFHTWRLVDLSYQDLIIMVKCSIRVDDITLAKRASDLILKNKNLYAESLYELGLYYITKEEYDICKGYFSRIIIESPSSSFVDYAKVEIADIYIKEERYEDAILKLKEINNKELHNRKTALLIISYFGMGKVNEATALTKKYLKKFRKVSYGEAVIKKNLLYYYTEKQIKKFKKYANYLKKYPGNIQFVNYLSGKINFEKNKYKSSYYYFYKLANTEGKYLDEALYYLGLISLFNNKNPKLAAKYFKKLSNKNNMDNKYTTRGKINLSLLSSELGDIDLSKNVLIDIMNNSGNKLLRIQAENLIEYFGYKEPDKKTGE